MQYSDLVSATVHIVLLSLLVGCGDSDYHRSVGDSYEARHPGYLQDDLWRAVQKGNVERLGRLIEKGADVEAKTAGGKNALILAIEGNRRNMVRLLLEVASANPNAADDQGQTALMYAASPGEDEKKHLHEITGLGLDPFRVKEEDSRPIATMEALLAAGARIDAKDNLDRTSLMYAMTRKKIETLISAGADVDAQDAYGMTALMLAVVECNLEAVAVLVDSGASLRIQNKKGEDAPSVLTATKLLDESTIEKYQDSRIDSEVRKRIESNRRLDCFEQAGMKIVLDPKDRR